MFSRTSNVSFSKKLASHRFVQIYNLWFRLSHRRVKCRRQESRIDQSARGRSARRVSLLLQFFIKCWNYERSLVFHVQIVSLSLISPRSIEVSKRRDLVTVRPRIKTRKCRELRSLQWLQIQRSVLTQETRYGADRSNSLPPSGEPNEIVVGVSRWLD